ncbi:hypothetical protein HK102_001818 [Quaeritorhiza haematococci]|nr:hypothetical protein HK102_001818 [Quaeritorhiza haematococci]
MVRGSHLGSSPDPPACYHTLKSSWNPGDLKSENKILWRFFFDALNFAVEINRSIAGESLDFVPDVAKRLERTADFILSFLFLEGGREGVKTDVKSTGKGDNEEELQDTATVDAVEQLDEKDYGNNSSLSAQLERKTARGSPALPSEILILILEYFDVSEKEVWESCSMVNKEWSAVARPAYWQRLISPRNTTIQQDSDGERKFLHHLIYCYESNRNYLLSHLKASTFSSGPPVATAPKSSSTSVLSAISDVSSWITDLEINVHYGMFWLSKRARNLPTLKALWIPHRYLKELIEIELHTLRELHIRFDHTPDPAINVAQATTFFSQLTHMFWTTSWWNQGLRSKTAVDCIVASAHGGLQMARLPEMESVDIERFLSHCSASSLRGLILRPNCDRSSTLGQAASTACSRLLALALRGSSIPDGYLDSFLRSCRSTLRHLEFSTARVRHTTLATVSQHCTALQHLYIYDDSKTKSDMVVTDLVRCVPRFGNKLKTLRICTENMERAKYDDLINVISGNFPALEYLQLPTDWHVCQMTSNSECQKNNFDGCTSKETFTQLQTRCKHLTRILTERYIESQPFFPTDVDFGKQAGLILKIPTEKREHYDELFRRRFWPLYAVR